jgi:hypothetical protein
LHQSPAERRRLRFGQKRASKGTKCIRATVERYGSKRSKCKCGPGLDPWCAPSRGSACTRVSLPRSRCPVECQLPELAVGEDGACTSLLGCPSRRHEPECFVSFHCGQIAPVSLAARCDVTAGLTCPICLRTCLESMNWHPPCRYAGECMANQPPASCSSRAYQHHETPRLPLDYIASNPALT